MNFYTDTIFDCKYDFQPAIIKEVVADNGEIETIFTPIKKETKKKQYLPGQRLLKSLNKDIKKTTKKKDPLNIANLEQALQNIMKEF